MVRRALFRAFPFLAALMMLATLAPPGGAAAIYDVSVWVSAAPEGGSAPGSRYSAVSADGRFVAFESVAADLVPGDTNGKSDVFVRDLATGAIDLVSRGLAGSAANGASVWPDVSGDGRYVAFVSSASNLVVGDTNNRADTFVFDRVARTTERVSVSATGAQADGSSDTNDRSTAISDDGRFVVFGTSAKNLMPGDTRWGEKAYLKDRATGVLSRVTLDSAGALVPGSLRAATISGDGGAVAWWQDSPNGNYEVFVRDLATGTTRQVHDVDGALDLHPMLSRDGKVVAYMAWRPDIGSTDHADMVAHDLVTGEKASLPACAALYGVPGLSGDGDSVVFASNGAAGLGVTPPTPAVYLWQWRTGHVEIISRGPAGAPDTAMPSFPAISGDGKVVTWDTITSFDADDTNGGLDVYGLKRFAGIY